MFCLILLAACTTSLVVNGDELGVIFEDLPKTPLYFAATVCAHDGRNILRIVTEEEAEINKSIDGEVE